MIAIRDLDAEETADILTRVSEECGYDFSQQEIADIIEYTVCKCESCGKEADYFPLLFEDELRWYIERNVISRWTEVKTNV